MGKKKKRSGLCSLKPLQRKHPVRRMHVHPWGFSRGHDKTRQLIVRPSAHPVPVHHTACRWQTALYELGLMCRHISDGVTDSLATLCHMHFVSTLVLPFGNAAHWMEATKITTRKNEAITEACTRWDMTFIPGFMMLLGHVPKYQPPTLAYCLSYQNAAKEM